MVWFVTQLTVLYHQNIAQLNRVSCLLQYCHSHNAKPTPSQLQAEKVVLRIYGTNAPSLHHPSLCLLHEIVPDRPQ